MKTPIIAVLAVLGTFAHAQEAGNVARVVVQEAGVSLAGRTYFRTFVGRPLGAPKDMEYTHSIELGKDGEVVDNGSTFFGNPPAHGKYKLEGNALTLSLKSGPGGYELKYAVSADGLTLTSGEQVLTLSLAGRTYKRKIKVKLGGPDGNPDGYEFEHFISFEGHDSAKDNSNSFFGNPAQTKKYKLADGAVMVGGTRYKISLDLKTLTNEAGGVLRLSEEN
jgi:hypothetical protein